VAEPLLNFADVGLVSESICGRSGTQGMDAKARDVHTSGAGVVLDDSCIDRARGQGFLEIATDRVLDRTEQRPIRVFLVSRGFNVAVNALKSRRVRWHEAHFSALPMYAEVQDAAALLHVSDFQTAQLLAA